MNQNQKLLRKIIRNSADAKLIGKAYKFAEKAHQGQKRKSGADYIEHPLKVAYYLSELKLSPTTIAAALLHDVVDDTDITLKEIKKEFGKEIAFLVEGVSKLGKIKYHGQQRQIENLRKLFLAMAEDIRVILIKLYDRLHNLETLNHLRPDKAKRIAQESLEIYAPLAYRLGMGELKGRLEDLSFPYVYPEQYRQLLDQVKDKYEEREKYLKKIKPLVKKYLKKEKIKPIEIHYRAKHYYSLYQKLKRYDNDLNKIYDLVALRIIVKDVQECYKALGIIHKYWKPLPGRIKDYIALPKPNGYRSLHTTVFCLDGKIIEFQVRTPQMHKEAEFGIAAHWYYSEQKGLKTYIKRLITKPPERKLTWVKQLKAYQERTKSLSPDRYLESLKIDFFNNRIFVFTPKGDVIDLPEGATPVDFAYAIHTEVGNHCQEAKVNGKLAPLRQPLKNGDLVEIILNKNKRPSRDWLKFVKTNLARSKIKASFKHEIKIEETSKEEDKETAISKTFLPIVRKRKKKAKPETKKTTGVVLAGQTGILANMAKCCSPCLGDKIVGYITKNNGVTVHRADCPNLKRVQKKWPQKIIKASWEKARWEKASWEKV